MCCARGGFLRNSPKLCGAASFTYFSPVNNFYKENNPGIMGFWRVAKESYF